MSPATTLRFALAGSRTDGARITLTALGAAFATLGLLAVATVLSIDSPPVSSNGTIHNAPYTNALLAEAGLRPGLSAVLVMLTIPVLLFVAQCSRLGASTRDRRLAAYRLGGATPGQTAWISATETGVAAVLGGVLGAAGYFVVRVLADDPRPNGLRPLPTDVLPPAWAIVVILVGVPLLVVGLSVLLLRRVTVTPFGVVRRTRNKRVRPWPGVLLVVGVLGLGFSGAGENALGRLHVHLPGGVILAAYFLLAVTVVVGLVAGTGWLSATAGRMLAGRARQPAKLLAGRRLLADPWSASRVLSVMVVAVLFGSGIAAMRSVLDTQDVADQRASAAVGESTVPNPFYDNTFRLIDIAVLVVLGVAVAGLLVLITEQVVTRRRSLVALVASGTPKAVLVRAQLLQLIVPAVPALLVAATAGTSTMFLMMGRAVRGAAADADGHWVSVRMTAPLPWAEFGLFVGGGIAAILVVSVIGLLFFRASTDIAELRTE